VLSTSKNATIELLLGNGAGSEGVATDIATSLGTRRVQRS